MKTYQILFLPAICGFATLANAAQTKVCTQAEQIEAMDAAPKDWKAFYRLFKRLGHCDDGAMAENFSDRVVKLLAEDWKNLDDLRILAVSDKSFQRFVLSHIDATVDADELRKVIGNAQQHCPSKAKRLCRLIESKAKSAYAEMKVF